MSKFTGNNQNILQNAAQRSASNARPSLFGAENVPASAGMGTKSPVPGGPITSAPNSVSGGASVVSVTEFVIPDVTIQPGAGGQGGANAQMRLPNGDLIYGILWTIPGTSLVFASQSDETSNPPVQYLTSQVVAWLDPSTGNSTPITMTPSTGYGIEGIPFQSVFVTWFGLTSTPTEPVPARFWIIFNPDEAANSTETAGLS